jgi:hypothetical protein
MDNLDPGAGNQDPQGESSAPVASAPMETSFSWKSKLGADLMNAPTMQKFEDTPEGLTKAVTSHLELEKMLGHEKVPIPNGPDDKDGWNRFQKAMGIPERAAEYGLPDAEIPESMKGMTFDKQKFADTVHAFKLTPSQAKGLWEAYTNMTKEVYGKALEDHQKNMTTVVNQMKSEWGDAYDTNVELGQMVINKFASDQDMQDFITANLAKDPRGIKFLSKIGSQFAENKVGDFSQKRFSLTPDQAQAEWDSIRRDGNHPYNNEKATQAERERAIAYVNSLISTVHRNKG